MQDPTYVRTEIDANPVWKLAFFLSEIDNDNAPLGWGEYILMARALISKYEMKEIIEPRTAKGSLD